MRTAFYTVVAALLASPVAEAMVYRDQVGQIDFHYQLLGRPQDQTTFFHRPRAAGRASLLYTLSDEGVLGAVNPGSGALVWRQLLGEEDEENTAEETTTTTTTTAHDGTHGRVVAVEGEGWLAAGLGDAVHGWDAGTGRSLWWAGFAGELVGLDVAAAETTGASRHNVLALFDEADETVVRLLQGTNGHVIWEHREAVADSAPVQVRAGPGGRVFVVSRVGGASSLRAVVLDGTTGARLEEQTLGAGGDVLLVGGGSAAAVVVAWTDAARSRVWASVLGVGARPTRYEFALPSDTAAVRVQTAHSLLAVHTRSAVLLDGRASHGGLVLHVDAATGAVRKVYDLAAAAGVGAVAISASVGGDAVYLTRVTDAEVVLLEAATGRTLDRWPVSDGIRAAGVASAEVVARPADSGSDHGEFAVRVAVVTDGDDWVLVRNGQLAWARPEGLTGAVAAAVADRPESEQLVRALEQEAHSNPLAAYVHRVRRHIDDLERLPAYVQATAQRIVNRILGSTTTTDGPPATDAFGFHKIAILATRRGRLYGLDAASPGTVLWSRQVVAVPDGQPWAVRRIHVDEAQGVATVFGPTAGLSVAVRTQTGEATDASVSLALLRAMTSDETAPIAATAAVTSAAGPWELAILDGGRVAGTIPVERCPHETVVVRHGATLQGLRFVASETCAPEVTWTFTPPAGGRLAAVAVRPAHDPVASIGRVLGDRRVLYKYLNPNVAVVAVVAGEDVAVLTTYLVDTVSGQVLAAAAHTGVDAEQPVTCVLFENTFACTFFGDGAALTGHQLAVSDLYASAQPNQRADGAWSSSVEPLEELADGMNAASAAGVPGLPAVFAQTWVVGGPLRALTVTQTRQGITTRQLLAYVPGTHGVLGLPRVGAVLDARRPVGRDPTPAEAEEGLTRYTPVLETDPRLVLSHERDVAGVRAIVAAPTHVESTSLVLAYGALDVFGTRVTPSLAFDLLDTGFGKGSMLATVAALAVGVAVLRPMVAKKQINMRWVAPL